MIHKKILKNLNDTKLVCCASKRDCEKVWMLIPELPTLFQDSEICDLFRPLDDLFEKRVRALYLGANFEDNGELFKRISKCSTHVRSQAELAVQVADELVFNTNATRYEAGMLVVRTFAGTGFDASQIEPDFIGDAITAISIDCFAGFSQTRLVDKDKIPPSLDERGVDAVEIGILAVIRFLSKANLTDTAFRRLMRRASTGPFHSLVGNETPYFKNLKTWPSALGWDDSLHNIIDGVEVRPLLSIKDLRNEGRVMDNCLASGVYDHDALFGRLAFFSMIAGDMQATLSLKLYVSEDETGQSVVEAYDIHDLKGPKNADPNPAFQSAAVLLIARLNASLPRSLDKNEIARRKKLEACFLARRATFCRDLQRAEEYWKRNYLPTLPSRLRHFRLEEVVDQIQDYDL